MPHNYRKLPLALLGHAVTLQLAISIARPASSYRGMELGIAPAFLGVVAGSFTLLPILCAYKAGRATDTGGRRMVLFGGAMLVVLGCLGLLLLSPNILMLLVWNMVLGVGHLLSIVGEQSLVAAGPSQSLAGAFGIYALATSAGQAAGPLVLALVGGAQTLPDTTPLFLAAVLAAVGMALTTAWLVPSKVSERAARDRASKVPGQHPLALGRGQRRQIYSAIGISSALLGGIDLIVAYLPALGVERNISAATIGVLLSLRAVFTMLSRLFVRSASLKLSTRSLTGLACGAFTVGTALLALPAGTIGIALSMLAIGIAFGFSQPLTMASVTQAAPNGTSGTWLAVRMGANRIGQTTLPAGLGVFATFTGTSAVFALAAGLLATASWVTWAVSRPGASNP
jgi:hypothetical protein